MDSSAIGSVSMPGGAPSARAQRDSPEKIKKAAQQFEALIIEQMLKSMRESSFGGGWGTSDQAGDTALQMADQQMAQMMASSGGLGLARVIEAGLKKSTAQTTARPAPSRAVQAEPSVPTASKP